MLYRSVDYRCILKVRVYCLDKNLNKKIIKYMKNIIKVSSAILVLLFGIWLGYSTNSLQEGIVGAISLLNCIILINLSYRAKQN